MGDSRQGLNTTLSYMDGGTRHAYQVRANLITHGMKVLSTQSASRIRQAFYPHRLTSAQFTVGIQLKGEDEYTSFSSWLASYANFILNIDLGFGEFPSMVVSIPEMNFLRKGVPISGYEWGDRVGGMVWTPQVVFESAGEPLEIAPALSSVQGFAQNTDPDVRYFYPTGTQLGGNDVPPDGTYTKVVSLSDLVAAIPVTVDANITAADRSGSGQGHRGEAIDAAASSAPPVVPSDVLNQTPIVDPGTASGLPWGK